MDILSESIEISLGILSFIPKKPKTVPRRAWRWDGTEQSEPETVVLILAGRGATTEKGQEGEPELGALRKC